MTIIYTPPANCVNLNSNALYLCFDKKDCNPSSYLLLKDCDDLYNCNRCPSDGFFFIPFQRGQPITFQLNELDTYNTDVENPTSGWGEWLCVSLLDASGGVLTGDVNNFATDHLVGYKDNASMQLLTIDTSVVPDCWSIRIEIKDRSGMVTKTLCSEPFQALPEPCEEEQVLCLSSDYKKKDCEGQCYTLPSSYTGTRNYKYDNELCFYANLQCETGQVTREYEGDVLQPTQYFDTYTVQLTCPIPRYMHEYLMKVILGGDNIYINGEAYKADTISPQNSLSSDCLYLYSFQVYKDCTAIGDGVGEDC